ncbi:MAG: ABC transporter substrate-binding protein, partial [Candidatus Bathyarchaeia archaeon]
MKTYQLAVVIAIGFVVALMAASSGFGVGPFPTPPPSRAIFEQATLTFVLPSEEFRPFYLPLLMAEEEEWFSERNLDVEIAYADSERDALDMVVSGKAQFAFVSAETVIMARAEGVPVRAVMQVYKNNPLGIAITEDSPLIESLRGKRIGIPSDAPQFFVETLLTQYDLEEEVELAMLDHSIRESDVTKTVDAFKSGKVDAVMVWATDLPLLRKAGVDAEFLALSSHGLNFPSIALVVSDSFMEEQEEVLLRTLNPIAKGLKWTVFSPASAAKIMAQSAPYTYGDPEMTEPVARKVGELIMGGSETKSDIWGV